MYQHDTPDKHLFAHEKRAYSHGCMRVQDPLKYGEVLLSLVLPNEKYTAERLQKMYGPSEININFPTYIPVHLTYQTAFVDDDGKLQIRDDVYGRDRRMLEILKGSERKVADTAGRSPKNTSAAPVRMPPGTFGGGGGYGFGGGRRSSTGCSAGPSRRRSGRAPASAVPTTGKASARQTSPTPTRWPGLSRPFRLRIRNAMLTPDDDMGACDGDRSAGGGGGGAGRRSIATKRRW